MTRSFRGGWGCKADCAPTGYGGAARRPTFRTHGEKFAPGLLQIKHFFHHREALAGIKIGDGLEEAAHLLLPA